MITTIQKWGNSKAVRLPKGLLESLDLQENDKVKINVDDGRVIITPLRKKITLRERLASYEGRYQPEEWDTGKSRGKELL